MVGEANTQKFYDRIADVHHVALRLNRYRQSVAKYINSLNLALPAGAKALDAGCGTGIQTLALGDSDLDFKQIISLDLSGKSLRVAKNHFRNDKKFDHRKVGVVQGNILTYPFEDNYFDFVLTCGALEYVPLEEGINEMARIMKPGGKLVFIPVKPSVVGSVLEFLYHFKKIDMDQLKNLTADRFNIVGSHKFPMTDPISWSKKVYLMEKKH